MAATADDNFVSPNSLDHAFSVLHDLGNRALPVAGATWVMRAAARGEKTDRTFIDLSQIPNIDDITIGADRVSVGALATQASLAECLTDIADLAALKIATGQSANPAIRRAATIGGNICTAAFAESDIVPALLALDADIEVSSPGDVKLIPMASFITARKTLNPSSLVTHILIPRKAQFSTHVRVTLRKAGDYPVANMSVTITLNAAGEIQTAAIAVGSVEPVAKRWESLEAAIVGKKPEPQLIREAAAAHISAFAGRDATGAPGWYRVRLLPALAAEAIRNFKDPASGAPSDH